MINNNWIDKFDKEFVADGEPRPYPTIAKGNWLNMVNPHTVKNFISNLLTQKEQEHKAELESIREEVISNRQTNFKTESDPDWFQGYGYNQGLQSVVIILDKHINK